MYYACHSVQAVNFLHRLIHLREAFGKESPNDLAFVLDCRLLQHLPRQLLHRKRSPHLRPPHLHLQPLTNCYKNLQEHR